MKNNNNNPFVPRGPAFSTRPTGPTRYPYTRVKGIDPSKLWVQALIAIAVTAVLWKTVGVTLYNYWKAGILF